MYLKRLEIHGFKSFPEKMKLEFDKGITAVVGPNGSGKSNVSDAVRWVLGEQSAKSLRGAKMEDVIFNGTQSRRPLSFAEVAMVIDNADGRMAVDYSEITVMRRVYRSGESQFLINGTACRLKDIHELFMDTGIGREGYSIIGQGRIEEILSTKSEDRRLLFEEAAGIVKFKNRKQEAEAKLERERQNLVRVNDIILELEKQIEPLRIQSEKARKYLGLAERQKLLHVNIFLQETAKTETDLSGMSQSMEEINAQIAQTTALQEKNKAETEGLRAELAALNESIDKSNENINELKIEQEKKENDIKLCMQNIEHIENNMARLKRDIEAKNVAIQQSGEARGAYDAKLNAATLELAMKSETLKARQRDFDELNEKLMESQSLIDKYSSEHIEKLNMTTDVKGRIQRAEAMYEQLEQRREELEEEKQYNLSRLNAADIKLQALQKELDEKNAKSQRLAKQIEMLTSDKAELQELIGGHKMELEKISNSLREAESRHKLLNELEAGYEGYYKSVKAVLKEKKRNPQGFKGIHGAVAELISVSEKYETAIEIALGGALQNIITDTEKDAQNAIEYLKKTKEGRATFLPLSSIKPRELGGNSGELLSQDGILGTAKQLIRYDAVYESIMSNLLGKVLIADSLDHAIAFSKKYRNEYKVVTLEGDLMNPGGAMTGGSIQKGAAGLLSRGREIASLASAVKELTAERQTLSEQLQDETAKRNSISDMIEKNKMLIQENELEKVSVNGGMMQAASQIEELKEKESDIEIEERQLMEQIVDANRQLRGLKTEQELIDMEISEILKTMDEKQSQTASDREAKDKKISELTEIQVVISGLTENITSIRENVSRIERDIKISKAEIVKFEGEVASYEIAKERKAVEIEELKEEIGNILVGRQHVAEEVAGLQERRQDVGEKLKGSEAAAIEKIELISRLNSELARLEVKKEQIETDNRKLFDQMWDEYNITYQAALKFERLGDTLPALQRQEREIRNEMKDLGGVNVNSIDEYIVVKERYEFMAKQRDDITSAEAKLNDIIAELRELMEKQFSEQFTIISKNFGIVFAEMFGGGTAYLKLSDESNILESGIEIISQPPGKSLQSMSLFSGGERALTATALLFAILRMKPSPFCILDEIEAALDDANVKRYANYLKNFADDTQFIVITHRKGTMEAADVLYGVTMQEQGVSKLVSVKFAEDTAI